MKKILIPFLVCSVVCPALSYSADGNDVGDIDAMFMSTEHFTGSSMYLEVKLDSSATNFAADCPEGAYTELVNSSGDAVSQGQTFSNYLQGRMFSAQEVHLEYNIVDNYAGVGVGNSRCEVIGVRQP